MWRVRASKSRKKNQPTQCVRVSQEHLDGDRHATAKRALQCGRHAVTPHHIPEARRTRCWVPALPHELRRAVLTHRTHTGATFDFGGGCGCSTGRLRCGGAFRFRSARARARGRNRGRTRARCTRVHHLVGVHELHLYGLQFEVVHVSAQAPLGIFALYPRAVRRRRSLRLCRHHVFGHHPRVSLHARVVPLPPRAAEDALEFRRRVGHAARHRAAAWRSGGGMHPELGLGGGDRASPRDVVESALLPLPQPLVFDELSVR